MSAQWISAQGKSPYSDIVTRYSEDRDCEARGIGDMDAWPGVLAGMQPPTPCNALAPLLCSEI